MTTLIWNSKFKKDQRVLVVACIGDRIDYTGHLGSVTRVTGYGSVLVELDHHLGLPVGHYGFYFSEEELEAVNEQP